MTIPHISYSGSCVVADTPIFCRDISFNAESKATFYKHTIGLQESYNINNVQNKYYRYAPVLPKASMSGFLTPETAVKLISLAQWGGIDPSNPIDEVVMSLWTTGKQRTLYNSYMQTLTIDIKAGEPASFSAEFVGMSLSPSSGSVTPIPAQQKLMTWDIFRISVNNTFFNDASVEINNNYTNPTTSVFDAISSFSFTVNNPVIPIYTSSVDDSSDPSISVTPNYLRIGMQETTGSITVYSPNSFLQGNGNITLTFPYGGVNFNVAFEPPSSKVSASSVFTSTTNFNCFSDSGRPWYPF